MEDQSTGSTMMLLPVVGGLFRVGVDPNTLLGRYGLSTADLADPHRRIENATLLAIWDEVTAVSRDPNFGLHAAKAYRRGMFRVLDYVVASAPTLRLALERGMRYLRILHDVGELSLTEDGDQGIVTSQPRSAVPPPRAQEDFFAACLTVVAREISGQDRSPTEVRFCHSEPDDTSVARELFRCPVLYEQEHVQIVFPLHYLDVPCVTADSALADVVTHHAQLLVDQLPKQQPIIYEVQRELSHQLADAPNLGAVAAALNTSPRTLRRRLADAGTSFKDVLAELRESMAKRLIHDPTLNLDEVAWLLGFSNSSAFFRAFKRWTGHTPDGYRRSLTSTADR